MQDYTERFLNPQLTVVCLVSNQCAFIPFLSSGHTNKVLSMMFDDTKVVSGSEDHTCRVSLALLVVILLLLSGFNHLTTHNTHTHNRYGIDWQASVMENCPLGTKVPCPLHFYYISSFNLLICASHVLVLSGKIWALQFDETALVTGSHDMSIRITKFDWLIDGILSSTEEGEGGLFCSLSHMCVSHSTVGHNTHTFVSNCQFSLLGDPPTSKC